MYHSATFQKLVLGRTRGASRHLNGGNYASLPSSNAFALETHMPPRVKLSNMTIHRRLVETSQIDAFQEARSAHCGGLFGDDDATAAEGLVRWCIEACKLLWSIEILKLGPIFVAYHTDEDRFWTLALQSLSGTTIQSVTWVKWKAKSISRRCGCTERFDGFEMPGPRPYREWE